MNYVTLLTLVITAAYLWYIGVIPSISDSYRTVKDIRVYHAFFFISAVLIACQSAYSTDELDIPYIIAGFFFMGISLAAKFWGDKFEGLLHVLFTYTAIVIGLALTVVRIWPVWGKLATVALVAIGISGAVLIHLFVRKNKTYWLEVWAYAVIFGPII